MRVTHPYLARLSHWLLAISVIVLSGSGLQIFQAFPSFGAKLPESARVPIPSWAGLGGWLGGALAWHFTFAWFFALAFLIYSIDLARGGWRRLHLSFVELRGIWPMFRYYFLRGPKPRVIALYNPLQKCAYLSITVAAALSLLTGLALAQPVQLGFLIAICGGWQAVRFLHFASLCMFLSFIPGHLIMVAIAGRSAMMAMLTGVPSTHGLIPEHDSAVPASAFGSTAAGKAAN